MPTLTGRRKRVGRRRLLLPLLLVSAATLGVNAYASAAPPTNGCPGGFALISVAQAESEGYPLARIADESIVKPLGNRDGYACRRPLGDGVFRGYPGRPDTIYLWYDNWLV